MERCYLSGSQRSKSYKKLRHTDQSSSRDSNWVLSGYEAVYIHCTGTRPWNAAIHFSYIAYADRHFLQGVGLQCKGYMSAAMTFEMSCCVDGTGPKSNFIIVGVPVLVLVII
jgi:hypothetical protein